MKKIAALFCALTMMFTMAACRNQAAPGPGNESGTESSVSGTVTESSPASNGAVSAAEPAAGSTASGSAPAKAVSAKVAANKNKNDYQIKNTDYSYKEDNISYKASYPQLTGKAANLSKVNETIKKSALKTITSLGTAPKAQKTTVKVNSDVVFEGKNFISIGFNEYTSLSPKAKEEHILRTVNINLKTGAAVGLTDVITKKDALYTALKKAAGAQLSAEQSSAVTVDAIRSGLDASALYFTDTTVGFTVQVTKPEKRQIRITLTYEEVKPYITTNEIWNNFI